MIKDDEIEKARGQYVVEHWDPVADSYDIGAIWQAGARWALSQYPGLDWKRPEEEMPNHEERVLTYSSIGFEFVSAIFLRLTNGAMWDANEIDLRVEDVLAWARIPLPKWLEEK